MPLDIRIRFDRAIRRLREEQNINQEEAAKRCGVHRTVLVRFRLFIRSLPINLGTDRKIGIVTKRAGRAGPRKFSQESKNVAGAEAGRAPFAVVQEAYWRHARRAQLRNSGMPRKHALQMCLGSRPIPRFRQRH